MLFGKFHGQNEKRETKTEWLQELENRSSSQIIQLKPINLYTRTTPKITLRRRGRQ